MRLYARQPIGTVPRARQLRREAPEPERRLLRALKEAFPDLKWRHQAPLGPFYTDILCFSERLIVEIAGDMHATTETYDATRTQFLNTEGYHVIRFTNADVMHNLDGVIAEITIHVPSPPVGEGGSGAQRRGRMRGSRET